MEPLALIEQGLHPKIGGPRQDAFCERQDALSVVIDLRWLPQERVAGFVFEQVKQRAEAEGVTVEAAANEAVRLGLREYRWQKLVKRGRTYSREMAEAATDDDALQIAVDAVHEHRSGR